MPLTAGSCLGPYEVIAPIGAGGMGEVWKARDTRLDRIVALKVSKESFSERFEREARVVASLNHPHIATLFDVGPNYLVMEYVEGEPLSGPLPLDKVMQYAAQICEALDAAHRKGITHRDLKPANILVNKKGIKLLDFGLAKIREDPDLSEETISKALTAHGAVLGTPQYMAPEQVEGKEADARSDIFSLGCVMYEMLTGRKAFAGKNASSIAAAILAKDPEPIAGLPPALERVTLTCLAKDPEDRWQSAREVRHALQWSAQLAPAPVAERKWLPWGVAAALGAALLGAIGVSYFQRPTATEQKAVQFQLQPPEKTVFDTDTGFPFSTSPDGRMIVFVADSQDRKRSLWIRPLDSPISRPLPGTEDAVGPFWSPDSRFVAFAVNDRKLKKIEVAGGTPQNICDLSHNTTGTWNSAGDILLTARDPGRLVWIQKVAATGGVPSDLKTDEAAGESVREPSFLPDGQHFLFQGGGSSPSVYVASLGGKGGRKLILERAQRARFMPAADRGHTGVAGYLFYQPEGTFSLTARPFDPDKLEFTGDAVQIAEEIVDYSASPSGVLAWQNRQPRTFQMTWLDDQGKALGTVGTPEPLVGISLSPDGRRVARLRRDPESQKVDLWTLDLARGVFSKLTSVGFALSAIWSRSGSRIFFSQLGTATFGDLSSISPDGGSAESVLKTPVRKLALDVTRDDRFLLYSENDPKTGRPSIWAMPLDGDRKPFPVVRGEFNAGEARFSPDGHWVAYSSDESGVAQVYIKKFPPTDQRIQVSNDGGAAPKWRPDGRQLYYRRKRSFLVAVDLKLGGTAEVSKPRELFTSPVTGLQDYEPAPDGKRFLTLIEDQATVATPLNIVVNWPATVLRGKP